MLTTNGQGASAWFSGCRRYRYLLTRRRIVPGAPLATFVMLNPSTADAFEDDPTIRRCIGFARSWGLNLRVVNLYGLRSTDPRELRRVDDPVGPHNDEHLADAAWCSWADNTPLVAAWGVHAKPERVAAVLALPHMDRLSALGVTKSGSPRHPLYLRGDSTLSPWPKEA